MEKVLINKEKNCLFKFNAFQKKLFPDFYALSNIRLILSKQKTLVFIVKNALI